MDGNKSIVVTFKTLEEESIMRLFLESYRDYEVIPVPTVISVTCGIAHRYEDNFFNAVVEPIYEDKLANGELPKEDVHFYIEEERDRRYSAFTVGGGQR